MADGHLVLGSNVQLGIVNFKVCNWPPETSLAGQSQILKSCWSNFGILLANQNQSDHKTLKSTKPSWTFEPRPKWPIINFKIPLAI